jgi:hypothetical protein
LVVIGPEEFGIYKEDNIRMKGGGEAPPPRPLKLLN